MYSGTPCSSDRYVMDNNVREVRDHPTLEGGEYDHEIYALSEDVPPSEGAPPSVARKAILVGPADVVGTLWRTNLCAILETRGKLRGGFSISRASPQRRVLLDSCVDSTLGLLGRR